MVSKEKYETLRLAVTNYEDLVPSLLCKMRKKELMKSLLYMALQKEDLPVLKILLDHGADIHEELEDKTKIEVLHPYDNERSNDKRIIKMTPINFAIDKGIPEIVEYLVKHCADVNQVHCANYEDCPLENRSAKIVRYLINLKDSANINELRACGCSKTSLEFAVEKGNLKIVEYLLNQGADMNIKTSISPELDHRDDQNECYTLLHRAVEIGNIEVVKLLLKKGADVNAKSQKTFPPDYTGFERSDWYAYPRYTLFAPNGGGTCILGRTLTVLEVALFKENEEMIDLLLEHGAAIDIESDQVFSLHTAIVKKVKFSIIEKLVEHGADVNSLSPAKKCTPLSHAVSNSDNLNVALNLLRKVAPININTLDTLLYETLLHNDEKNCEFLINCGANVNSRNLNGASALHIAVSAQKQNSKKTRVLLNYGADVNAQNKDGNTPLHLAINKERYRTALVLLQYDADISILNYHGESPFFIAYGCSKYFCHIESLIRDEWDYSRCFKKKYPDNTLCGFCIILMIILREAFGQHVAERDLWFIRSEPMHPIYDAESNETEKYYRKCFLL